MGSCPGGQSSKKKITLVSVLYDVQMDQTMTESSFHKPYSSMGRNEYGKFVIMYIFTSFEVQFFQGFIFTPFHGH